MPASAASPKKISLGYRTILVGWSLAALLFLWPTPLASGTIILAGFAILAVTAFLLFREWRGLSQVAMAEGGELAAGVAGQARNHGLALVATGVIVGTPLTALALYLLVGLAGALGLGGSEAYSMAFVGLVAIAGVASWLLARGWATNCAPDWIDG